MELYLINQEVANILNSEDEEQKEYLLSQIKLNLEEKTEELTKFVRNNETAALAIDDEIKRLSERKRGMLDQAEKVKGHIKMAMEQNGLKKMAFNNFTLTIAKCPDHVVVLDEAKIPKKYWVEKVLKNIDKAKLKEALKDGQVEGAQLEADTALRIK